MSGQEYWNQVYRLKHSDEVSWFQSTPASSLRLLDLAGIKPGSCVIDVGGGDSRLTDALLDRGLSCVSVLDISSVAIARAQARLGARAAVVSWIVADVTGSWISAPVDLWHDRAAFHFLVSAADRTQYRANLRRTLKPGGHVAIATFAQDGPEKCSGLPVQRYSGASLETEFGSDFTLVHSFVEPHATPAGKIQPFLHALLRKSS